MEVEISNNPKVAGSNPAEDNQGNELFGEIALKNQRFVVIVVALPFSIY